MLQGINERSSQRGEANHGWIISGVSAGAFTASGTLSGAPMHLRAAEHDSWRLVTNFSHHSLVKNDTKATSLKVHTFSWVAWQYCVEVAVGGSPLKVSSTSEAFCHNLDERVTS